MPTPDHLVDGPAVGLVFDDRYLQHHPGLESIWPDGEPFPFVDPVMHLSNHRLVMRTKHLIDRTGLGKRLVRIDARAATVEELAAYHTRQYIARIEALCAVGGGDSGQGAPVASDSYEIALLAAGGGIAAVDAAFARRAPRAFANVRPPGHHAISDFGMGFCVFNNIVVAARHAQRTYGITRIMIVDWDVHHGNGTQDAFYGDPDVLFVSLHQDDLYPRGSGTVEQTGSGPGEGFTVNIPLPAGSGDATYRAAFAGLILPIANEFQPELVLISAGQDASLMDQLGRMCLTTDAYRWMTGALMGIADHHAGGKLVAMQEGGYSELYGPYCTLAIVEALTGTLTGVKEPHVIEYVTSMPYARTVSRDAEDALGRVLAQQAAYWPVLRG